MAKATKFMVVHNEPGMTCEAVQANWRKLADHETASWIRTYYNQGKGLRYCLWMAESQKELEKIFTEMGIGWESIVPVVDVSPDLWGEKWSQHLARERVAATLGN